MVTVQKPGTSVKSISVRVSGMKFDLTPETDSKILFLAVKELARVVLVNNQRKSNG